MDKKTVFIKTEKGESEAGNLSSDLKRILMLIDNKSTSGELAKRAPPSLRESWVEIVGELEAGGYIRDKDKHIVEPKITKPKFNPLKMFTPKPVEQVAPRVAATPPVDDLDFSNMGAEPVPDKAEATKKQAEVASRGHAAMEAAVAAAKVRASAEAAAKAEAKAKQEAEAASRARVAAEAKAKQEAQLREQAEAKAKLESAARLRAQQEVVQAKAAQEAASRAKVEAEAKVRAEIEKAARAQQEAEAKAKQESEAARLKAEKESARIKAELEAAERAKAEAEARARAEIEAAARAKQEAEARAKAEAEAARLKAEEEAARVKAELAAAAKAKAEAEEARLKAEAEAARVRAELAAAKARAEAEAKALAEARARELAEEKARQEAEARLKAEQQAAARLKAEQEAEAARIRAEQEAAAKRKAEENARRAAELAEQEAQAEEEAEEESPTPYSASPAAFEINLDGFLGKPEPVKKPAKSSNQESKAKAEAQARQEAEQRAADEAKAKSEKAAQQKNIAAEMERLKQEADKARLKAEQEAKQKAEEQALAEEQAKAWAEAEHRAKTQAVLEAEQAAQQAALSEAKAKRPVASRKVRKPLPLGKITFALILLALVTVIVLPYVFPLKEYIAPLEKLLSAQLKQPVHIGAMSASSLPPKLQLQNVTVGSAKEVKIGTVVLSFDPLSLFSEVKVIGDAELQEFSIAGNSLIKQAASLELLGSNVQYPVRHLTLQKVTIVTDEIKLPSFSGIAELDTLGTFSRISLHSPDDKLGVDLSNDAGRWQLGVNLKESSLPALPDVVFSDLSAKGVLSENGVNFTEMDAHIFDGILLGSAQLSWNRGWQLHGTLEAKTFDLDKMFPDFHVEGDMYGEGTYSLSGAKLSKMDEAPHLDGTFTVKKGTFNVDMVETARLLSHDNLVGGRTHFDEMSGQVVLDNHTVHFKQLKITSEMLNSSGSFEVTSGKQLSGNFNAEIKMRSGNNQLSLYGTVTEPKLRAGH